MKNFIKSIFINLIKGYQYLISPLFAPSCRFTPTCSSYAKESFEKLPLHIAIIKSTWRILRCHPFAKGGHDPVLPEEALDFHKKESKK